MSLENWVREGWLSRHQTSAQEITQLLAAADRDLADSKSPSLSPDWRLNIAHNCAVVSATAALAASGYRAAREGYHYRVLQSLAYTIGAEQEIINRLDVLRKKRNISGYERPGFVSELEANEMISLARDIRGKVEAWLHLHHSDLIEDLKA